MMKEFHSQLMMKEFFSLPSGAEEEEGGGEFNPIIRNSIL